MKTLAQIHTGVTFERLLCHPRLPLIAGWDSTRPAIHIWELAAGQLREAGVIGAEAAGYDDDCHKRRLATPDAAWHPAEPQLFAADGTGTTRWTAEGITAVDGFEAEDWYKRKVAVSPDGRTLWLAPFREVEGPLYGVALDLATGAAVLGSNWDTGIAAHPGGGLIATLQSNQGTSMLVFCRDTGPALRPLRRALLLDGDGYGRPLFSPDGRLLVVPCGDGAETLKVFEFPSLRMVLSLALSEPDRAELDRHDLAFGPQPGTLWISTPEGVLVELDLDTRQADDHEVLPGTAITAMTSTVTGDLVVAGADGTLLVLSVEQGARAEPSAAAVAEFLAGTTEAEIVRIEEMDVTDGVRSWSPEDMATVTDASADDPAWLQKKAVMSEYF